MGSADLGERLATINGAVGSGVENVDNVGILGVREDVRVVPGPLAVAPVVVHELPFFSAVVGAEQPAFLGLNERINTIWIRSGCDSNAAEGAFRQAIAGQLGPGVSAIRRAIQAAAWASAFHRPRLAHRLPHSGKQNVRIREIELNIDAAGLVVYVKNSLPCLAAVARTENAARGIRPEWVSQCGDVDDIRILRVNDHPSDRVSIAKSRVFPGLAGVDGFVHAIAHHDVSTDAGFAGADIDHIRVGWSDGDSPD